LSGKSRTERVLGRMMRKPILLRMWQLLPTPPAIVLVHRGRKSGKLYETPLSILVEYPEQEELVVSPMWGKDSDWYWNVTAGGLVEIRVRGETRRVESHELGEAERRAAGEAFRNAHPIYGRMILRMLARLNGFEGDPYEAAVQNLPMLGLRRIRRQDPQG
jgi:deazaflavin-dependent oxidoreductase (nitroreductase family)